MKETHDASVVKFDSVCVDLFFRRLATNGKLKKRDGEFWLYHLQNYDAHFVEEDRRSLRLV